MSVLEDLATWLEEADRFRCDARLPSPELTEWPDFPEFTVTVIGAPAVGKSTLLTGLIAPAESPFEPAPVSTALRDPAAYRRAPLNWGSTVDAESASVIVRGRTRSPALAGTLFGLRLREGWGFAVEAEESTNATLAEVLPKHGKGATILVLRAEAPLSRAELEGIRALASAGRAPEIIVANVRGGMGLEDQGKVRTFVARQLEGLGPDANLPVMVADVSSGTGDGDEAKVRAAIDGAIRAHAAVAKAAALLECACLGAPSDLALARAKLEEDKVAAAAVAAQRSDQAERLRDQVDEAQKSMEAVIAGIDRRREERKKAIAGSAGVDVPRTAAEWAERRSAIQATVGAHLLPPPDLEAQTGPTDRRRRAPRWLATRVEHAPSGHCPPACRGCRSGSRCRAARPPAATPSGSVQGFECGRAPRRRRCGTGNVHREIDGREAHCGVAGTSRASPGTALRSHREPPSPGCTERGRRGVDGAADGTEPAPLGNPSGTR